MQGYSLKKLQIEAEEADQRLDKVLARRLKLPRNEIADCFKNAQVKLDGKIVKASFKAPLAASVEIYLKAPEAELKPSLELSDYGVKILYEDAYLLLVNKPRGLICHPGVRQPDNSLIDWLRLYLGKKAEAGEKGREGLVHRLDQGTSGALVLVKDQSAYLKLKEQFMKRTVVREYLALVCGQPPTAEGEIRYKIGRNPQRPTSFCCRPDGREAITHYRSLSSTGRYSLLSCSLETGRTHQIRVHLKALNCPIWGDELYAPKHALDAQFMALHAYHLRFKHPISGKEMDFWLPPPADFMDLLDQLDLKAALPPLLLENEGCYN
ncbi:MAG: RluA family pseudouridine synthase [Eubacteriales bacterium]|nr:RluA family pseudouridine synthase [Eubacteriales bacterium]